MEDTKKRLLLLNMQIQQKSNELFFNIMSYLKGKYQEFEILTDENFEKNKNRIFSDTHLFIKLKSGNYFHLKSYSEQNSQNFEKFSNGEIYLTGYLKQTKEWKGTNHKFEQKWYKQNAKKIALEILNQNKELF